MTNNLPNIEVIYEDNHLIVINKRSGDIVQGDKTGDKPLLNIVKDYIKIKKEVNSEIVKRIIGENNWREKIVGAFFCAIENLTEFEDIIGISFLKSEFVYQGKGFALALASFSSEKSINYLKKYLDYYLTRQDLEYDQNYAMSALKWIDEKTKSEHTEEYKQKYAEWEKGSKRKFESYYNEFTEQMLIIEELKTAGNTV